MALSFDRTRKEQGKNKENMGDDTLKEELTGPVRPNLLSPQDAIKLVGQFLCKEWKHLKPEDVEVERIQ